MQRSKIFILLLGIFLLSLIMLPAQTDDLLNSDDLLDLLGEDPQTDNQSDSDTLLETDNLDDLLNNPEDSQEKTEEEKENTSVLEEMLDQTSLTLKSGFSLQLGYSPGWLDTDADPITEVYKDSSVWSLSSTLSADYRLNKQIRFYQSWSITWPDFDISLGQFYMDFTPTDNLLFQAGQYSLKWGESRNFSHTNLLGRLPSDYSGGTDPLTLRLSIPWGTGGIDAVSLSYNGMWEDPKEPDIEEFGWGIKVNPPMGPYDVNLAFYYHPEMKIRSSLSLRTTLFQKLETYGELLMTVDPSLEDQTLESGETDKAIDYSANLGLYTDFFKQRLTLGAEYFYNGEESQLEMTGNQWELYKENNWAFYAGWKEGPLDIKAYARLHPKSESGIIGPALTWKAMENLTLQAGGGWVWGEEGYALDNPDPLDREAFTFIQLKFSGNWKTEL